MTCAHSQAALFAMGSSAFDVLDIASASIGKVTHLVGCIDDDVQHLVAPLHVVEIAAHLLSNHVVPDTLSPSLPSSSPVVWAERSWWTMDGRGVIAAVVSLSPHHRRRYRSWSSPSSPPPSRPHPHCHPNRPRRCPRFRCPRHNGGVGQQVMAVVIADGW